MILFLLLLTCWLIFLKSFFSQFICRWHCWCQNKRYISIFFKTFAVDAVVIEKMFWKTSRLVLKSALLTLLTWKNSTHLHFFPTYLLLTLLMPKEVYSYILTLTIYMLQPVYKLSLCINQFINWLKYLLVYKLVYK